MISVSRGYGSSRHYKTFRKDLYCHPRLLDHNRIPVRLQERVYRLTMLWQKVWNLNWYRINCLEIMKCLPDMNQTMYGRHFSDLILF